MSQTFIEINQLGVGKTFGELSLITNKPRAARILALEPTHVAVIDKADYLRVLTKITNTLTDQAVVFFKEHPTFSHFSKAKIYKIVSVFVVQKCKKGAVIVKEGHPLKKLFIVKEGEFLVSRKQEDKTAELRRMDLDFTPSKTHTNVNVRSINLITI